MNDKPLHEGHRERLTQKFINSGDTALEVHELLEALLFYPIPRQNTNETAHRLLNEFGDLRGILSADPERLFEIEGVGEKTVLYLKLWNAAFSHMNRPVNRKPPKAFHTMYEAGEFLLAHFKPLRHEELTVLLLDHESRLIKQQSFPRGNPTAVSADPLALASLAAKHHAAGVILAHNHISDDLSPSKEDLAFTATAEEKLSALGIYLIEHFIVGSFAYRPILPFLPENDTVQSMKSFYK